MSAQLDQVSADLHQFEAEQAQAEHRAAFVAATRNEWLGQAITEEIENDLLADLRASTYDLEDMGKDAVKPLVEAFKTNDHAEIGRLIVMMMRPVIAEEATARAERMAAEQFDAPIVASRKGDLK